MKRLLILLLIVGFVSCEPKETADIVLYGKVVTVDEQFSIQEAVAIKDNKIVFVGSKSQAEAFVGDSTNVIDTNGKMIMPGMHDSHCHPDNLGRTGESNVFSLSHAKDLNDLARIVGEKVKTMKPGEWIVGSGWNHEKWPGRQLPVHDVVSKVSPDNPMFLYRQGGNSAFVNAKALEIAGITKDTPDPFGGKIYRKPNGEPTGFVKNMGNDLIKEHIPKTIHPNSYYENILKRSAEIVHKDGLTGWTDAGSFPEWVEAYKSLTDKDELNIRANIMIKNPRKGDLEAFFKKMRMVNYGGEDMLQLRSIKVWYDGTLGSRGAALHKDYSDDPGNRGLSEVPPEHVYEVSKIALRTGMQVAPHALGTRGNTEILDAFERALKENPVKDHRFRSEHAEVVNDEDIKRFAELGVIPSIQPIHCTSDMTFIEYRLGKGRSREHGSPWRKMLNEGLILACGSDFTVESHKPLWGIYAAITRQDHNGFPENGWNPEQRMTRIEAIKGYTIWGAYAAFLEDKVGSLEVGKYADIVVLDTDLLECEPKEIIDAKVEYTIVNGKIVYEKGI